MAKQDIIIGAENAKQGDSLFDAFTKTESNFSELYKLTQSGNNTVYLRSEDDLPNKTATTWTMDSNVPYKLAASFTTSLQCIPVGGASLRGDNLGSFVLSFSGSGSMFKGVDVDFYINNVAINPGATNTAFEFSDTIGSVHRFIAQNVTVLSCDVWAKSTNMLLFQVNNCGSSNAANGVQFFGALGRIWSISRFAITSTNSNFVGLDLGSAIVPVCEIGNLVFSAPAGAVGVSGLPNSGNIPVGRLARLNSSEFLGSMTDLQGLSSSNDTRWAFFENSPTPDTQPDALTSFRGNALVTTITTINTPVLVSAVWVEVQASLFTTTSSGRVVYEAERALKAPITVSAGVVAVGGGSIDATAYIAKNSAVIPASGVSISVSGSKSETLTIPWQDTVSQGDYYEVFIENNSGTTNIIVDHAILRVL
tara:strand:- start:18714 stop:19979 length:1266 start_codon:yes stop_codon:yes gene_type:complete